MIEITKTPGYQVGETFYPTVEAAQQGALTSVLVDAPSDETWKHEDWAKYLIANKDSVIAILRLKPRKKRAARKVAATAVAKPAGRKRKATVEEEAATGD